MHTLDVYATHPDGTKENLSLQFPSDWAEITPAQLPMLALARTAAPTDGGVRYMLLRELACVPDHLMSSPDMTAEAVTFEGDEGWSILPQLDWVFSSPLYDKSGLAVINHAGMRWIGPGDNLEEMVLDQWLFCCELMNRYRSAKEPAEQLAHLQDFLGAAYQPDYATFSSKPIEEYGRMLATLPMSTKLTAVLNFEALNACLPIQYSRVFNPDGRSARSPMGMFSIPYDVAKSAVLGDVDKVRNRRLHDVLGYMEHALFQDEERERERQEQSRKTTI